MSSYVLGGGIAGLVWAFYHPEYKVIAEKKGGSMASPLSIGPRWLHANAQTETFARKLGFMTGDRVMVRAGFVPPCSSSDYMLKTRGIAGDALNGLLDGAMTNAHEVLMFPTLREITDRLIEILDSEKRIVEGRVEKIDLVLGDLALADGSFLALERLINTVPLPQFAKLLSRPDQLAWGGEYHKIPVLFNHHVIADGVWPWPGFEYVYVPDPALPFSRITRLTDETAGNDGFDDSPLYACVEYPGADALKHDRGVGTTCRYLRSFLDVEPCASSVLFPYGRIVSRSLPEATRGALALAGIKMFGRFATWTDWILTHHLIKMAEANTWETL